ncbi:MAG TPA: aspartyl protease family protein [Pyrinomonadaceae bacterium]|jgi:aspartyl protease/PDZ domain-containing protein|nr:aspartyl protease family protein [Pyrinomonadaceae bacterium]
MRTRLSSRRSLLTVSLLIAACLTNVSVRAAQRRSQKPSTQSGPAHKFSSGSSAHAIRFELINSLVLVQARVNNSDPLWFIFDTGATNTVIDTKRAAGLGLKARGKIVSTGSAGQAEAQSVRNTTIQFPGFEIARLTVYTLPIDFFSAHFGFPISGIIGNDIIGRVVSEIDYEKKELSFYDVTSYRPEAGGQTFPVTLQDRLPMIQTEFELANRQFSGIFEIDTGSTGALQINTPFVRRHRLLSLAKRSKKERLGGVGGTAEAVATRLESVTLGKYRLANSIGKLSLAKQGDYSSRRYDGLLGGQIFRRFKLIVDLSRRRITFQPNNSLNDPFEADMSGLELVADGDDLATYVIDDLEPGTPAVEAGIKGGETLLAIDGRPASEFSLEEIRRMFMYDGREYDLTLKRDAETIHVKLKLRRLV